MNLAANPACNSKCGACHYKALSYPDQLARKQAWAKKQLGSWGERLAEIRLAPEVDRLEYRAKSWLRAHWSGAGELSFGMYRAIPVGGGHWDQEFISWDTCPLHVRGIQVMTERLRGRLAREAPEFCASSLLGVWMGEPHVVIVAREPVPAALKALDWGEILSPPFDRVWYHRTNQVGRKVFQHREFLSLHGGERSGAPDEGHPILAFRQIARTLLIEARRQAVAALLAPAPRMVLDLYCGTGELSRLIPASVGWLGIELSLDAVEHANRLRAESAVVAHAAYVGTIEQRLRDNRLVARIAEPYSLYLNPPRTGMSEEARERVMELVRKKPAICIVYLSCSASSLSRDLKAFESAGYRVSSLQPFDFFPQTEHFETLALLERRI